MHHQSGHWQHTGSGSSVLVRALQLGVGSARPWLLLQPLRVDGISARRASVSQRTRAGMGRGCWRATYRHEGRAIVGSSAGHAQQGAAEVSELQQQHGGCPEIRQLEPDSDQHACVRGEGQP
eukprot:scaffold2036_cov115-Isochrysis_galbana.AAC.20